MMRRFRAFHADTRGVSLTEVLVGTVIGAMIMAVVATTVFTTNGVRLRADDRSQFAADLSVASLSFNRDGVMATNVATAELQTAVTTCGTPIDLGLIEGGATTVRYRTAAGRLERLSASGTRTLMRNVSSCTWQSVRDGTGRYTILMSLALSGVSGETLTQILRVAPRSW